MSGPEISKLIGMAAAGAPAAAKLKKATQDLEAIFVKDLLSAMRKTVKHESLGSSAGTEIYQDLFDQALSESASKSGTLGVGKTIYDQMAPHAIRAAWARAKSEPRGASVPLAGSEPVPGSSESQGLGTAGKMPAKPEGETPSAQKTK